MATDIVPMAELHFQMIVAHPWIEAALVGALIGLAGASLYIVVSCLSRTISDKRRSSNALAYIARFNEDRSPAELDVYTERQIFKPSDLKRTGPESRQSAIDPRPSR